MKKYELNDDTITLMNGRKLYRIRALKDFSDVEKGDFGGYVEKEENLSHGDDCWVYGNARVFGDARVFDNARAYNNARVCGNAEVCGNARVCGNADYITAKGFGSCQRNTTFFKQKDGSIGVRCGCFYGTIDEFRNKVKETHGESKLAKEYLMLADLMEYHFKEE